MDGAESDIAIVGMAGRFPNAPDLDAFWRNLRDGFDSVVSLTDEELLAAGVAPALLTNPNYVKSGVFLDDVDLFDNDFFGFTPRDAALIDPQQRVFLECAWEALESAGYDASRYRGAIGVFAGVSISSYLVTLYSNRSVLNRVSSFQLMIGNDKDYLPTRVSYKLDLRGPSVTVQTACSTSLVAVHMACQSLLSGESEMALAGAASIQILQRRGYLYQEGSIMSPDGHCRAFDAEARGTIGGTGVGIVLLKRLVNALNDGDVIHAVIKGSAINNDGASKVGYTAPSVNGQAHVISEALSMAGVKAESVTYVEAHGTGTPLGDPIEIAALTKAFGAHTTKKNFCAIGSVKTNIGHLDVAAGMAGLIKTVLALKHKQLPPSLHFTRPNPKIDFANSPFFVNANLRAWEGSNTPRRAGVSSFGIGGTNAHVVLEEAPAPQESGDSRAWQLLVWSAHTQSALEKMTDGLADYLQKNPGVNIADVCYTLSIGRKTFDHRRMLVCSDGADACGALAVRDAARVLTQVQKPCARDVIFMFSGQGAQRVNMGRWLYRSEAIFREHVDRCAEILTTHLGFDLRTALYPAEEQTEAAEVRLKQTGITQPALFVTEYALAQLWSHWGVRPAAMIGHSLGEYVAACLAGVLSLEDALALVAVRGTLMQSLASGAMLAVPFGEDEARLIVSDGNLSLACVNGPRACVISGTVQEIEGLEKRLSADGMACLRLKTSHAFHSAMTDPILNDFSRVLNQVKLSAPAIPYVSNLTGDWIKAEQATDPRYWARHLRETVRFSDGLSRLLAEPEHVFVEVGPGQALCTFLKRHPEKSGNHVAVPSLPDGNGDELEQAALLKALGQLWQAGVELNWDGFFAGERRRRINLPTYPFERQRCWVDPERPTPSHTDNGHRNEEASMSNRQTAVVADSPRKTKILVTLKTLVKELTGINPENIDIHAKFLEAGIDSLTLIQATQLVKEQYDVKLSVVQLVEELSNMDSLATYIDTKLPADPIEEVPKSEPALEPVPQPAVPPSLSFTPPGQSSIPALDQFMSQQLHILAQQLEIMRAAYQNGGPTGPQPAQSVPASPVIERESSVSPAPVRASFIQSQPTFVPYQPIEPDPPDGLTEKQRRHLDDLIARHNFRTRESKRLTQEYRRHLADSRTSLGFRLLWKELIYPIIGDRSSGSKIWDVDGNEYVDISMGFGVHLFGHSPDFIYEAIKQEIDRKGLQLGTQIFLAGKVARLISELTGQERVNFCNSGTEAVMGALRIARTVTRRSRVAIFAGAYHGWWDGTLAKVVAVNGEQRTMPVGPGISAKAVEDLVVLGWDSPDSIEYLNKHAHELAAVMVEPVQSRRPDIQPREFLHELRQLTARTGTALIFDEMITGFRVHRGGAQAWFGVEADIATYGKVIGGGLPIGVIAGKAAFMNAFDGGMWNYGDGSYPESEKTLFAGTFFKHPLAIAAARVLLERLRDNPSLLPDLNDHTARLVAMLNQYFDDAGLPINVVNFGSLFRFILAPELKYVDLFFYHMLDRGVFVWEGRTCFLSTAHTEDDFSSVVGAVAGSVDQMRAGGFWREPLRKTNGRTSPASVGAVAVEHADVRSIPLTDAQRQLWITAQIGPDALRAYNESVTLRMRGRFDPQSMRRAIEQLIERHELLRATFSSDGEYQLIHPAMSIDIPLVDFSHLQENAREAEAQAWITREIGESFDLERGPLVRFTIVKMDEDLHLVIFNTHHLIIDGQSWGVLLKDLEELYSAAHRGVASQLPPPRGFSYYVERLHQFQRHSNAHTSEEYWLKLFRDCVPVLRLPTDRPRPPVQTYNGKRLLIATDASLFEKAKITCAEQGSTLYMTLLAAYSALLHRLSGQQKIIVGIPAAGQLAIGCKNSVGYCVNLMPLLSDAGDNPTFADYLATVKRSLMESLEHQHYSFSRLLKRLDIPWDASRSPLFTTIFNIDRIDPAAKFSDLELEVITDSTDWARYDLRMNLIESDKLLLECTFNTDLFDESTIRRWMGYFQTLLSAVCDGPTRRVRNLSLVTEDEARQLLVTWNDTAADDLPTEEFHRLFEVQADQTPESVAVICEDERLSYRDLNVMSNRLARHLRRRGVGPETTVALYCERSAEMIVALLAVIKAGGAYVPLDPSYPRERLRFMLADCAARIVLTHEQQCTVFEDCGTEVICLDSNRNEWLEESGEDLEGGAAASNLAYIIYTSGSTGRPKGVCIEHRQLLNYVRGVSHSLSLPKGGNFATVSTFAADLGHTMIFPALCGGTLHVITEDKLVNPDALAEYFERHKIDCLKVVPSHLEALLMARHPEQVLPRLRLILGGEVAQPGLLARLGELEPACEVFNHYGPTESTVGVLTFHVPKERLQVPAAEAAALPLGRPIANTRVYVLDAHGQPVPPGVYGELYVGGKGVARGYHNQPELTAERFVPDRFSGEPGARLYRTGDVGRHLPNGEIEFAGRTDNQVKIAGQRIEPGEIEVALGEHPAVREAIVVTCDHLPGERGLVAYVVAQLETPVSISELRRHLRQRLPQYMQPAAFVMLDKMPLTTNGKIDRHALPGPDATRPEMDQAYEQPRTVVEERLAQVWSEVLRLEHLGVHDNFFELGGNSLLGTKMTARVRDRFQVQLTLRNLFESPTIAELSALIVARQSTTEAVCPEPVAAPRMRVDQLLSSVDHLPEAEVELLLEELLAEEKAM